VSASVDVEVVPDELEPELEPVPDEPPDEPVPDPLACAVTDTVSVAVLLW
jgi:hypothetical protein